MSAEAQLVAGAVNAWNAHVKQIENLFAQFSDDHMSAHIAPGKNRMVYLLGHLVAVNDGMLPLLGFGDRLHPQLERRYIAEADKENGGSPSVAELRAHWTQVHAALTTAFKSMAASDWLAKHTAVSDEDFATQPHRNRFAILLSRTNHLAYHLGQMMLAPKPVV
ncbi:MAG: DinB family protein [Phycisphaerae bacterium]|nr:DinB family protein [Gemmatimonadaceae bacterium]